MFSEEEYVTIRTVSSGKIYKRTDGILVLRQLPEKDNVTVLELKEQLEVFLEIQNGTLSPLLIVVERLKRLENEEKMFLTSTVTKFANKAAMVANSPIPVFLVNILLFIYRPAIPVKIFTNEAEALKWLQQN